MDYDIERLEYHPPSFEIVLKPFCVREYKNPGCILSCVRHIEFRNEGIHSFYCDIYTNGQNESENGDISIMFKKTYEYTRHYKILTRTDVPRRFTVSCTLSLKDKDGNLRFPQSFAYDKEPDEIIPMDTISESFGLEKFISLEYLSENTEEFLPDGALTFHCDIEAEDEYSPHPIQITDMDIQEVKLLDEVGNFKLYFGSEEFDALREYEYFKILENSSMKETELQCIEIDQSERLTFLSMIIYAKKKNIDHIYTLRQLFELYVVSNKYQMLDLFSICSDELKNYITEENAYMIRNTASMHCDQDLEEFANEYISNHSECSETDCCAFDENFEVNSYSANLMSSTLQLSHLSNDEDLVLDCFK